MSDANVRDAKKLAPGTDVTIVKLKPDGSEAIRYPGKSVEAPHDWVAARASWGRERVDLGYLIFEPSDVFLEYFSLTQSFNAFAIRNAEGTLKGWYCNVTQPTWVEAQTIFWHDLYVDVIAYPDGRTLVLDEDELQASGLETTDPELYLSILQSRDRLLKRISDRQYPFDQ